MIGLSISYSFYILFYLKQCNKIADTVVDVDAMSMSMSPIGWSIHIQQLGYHPVYSFVGVVNIVVSVVFVFVIVVGRLVG